MIIDGIQYGLTAEQIAKRRFSIGGSDANIIMSGDGEKIYRLWEQKTGRREPDDLSDVLPVQMGSYTEAFNRFWYTKTTGYAVTDVGCEVRLSPRGVPMTATLDGVVVVTRAVFEAKHVGAFSDIDDVLARYFPQLTHNMIASGRDKATLSVLVGTFEHHIRDVDLDPTYADALIEAEGVFWQHVRDDTPPVDLPSMKSPVPFEKLRKVDMTGNNAWADAATSWRDNKAAVDMFDAAKTLIKSMVEHDVGEAYGHGIVAKKSKAGAITIKEAK